MIRLIPPETALAQSVGNQHYWLDESTNTLNEWCCVDNGVHISSHSGGLEDRVNCADMEVKGRYSRSVEVSGHDAPTSCNEGAGEDSGWEDK